MKLVVCVPIQLNTPGVNLGTKVLLAYGVLLFASHLIALDCRDTPLDQYFESPMLF